MGRPTDPDGDDNEITTTVDLTGVGFIRWLDNVFTFESTGTNDVGLFSFSIRCTDEEGDSNDYRINL